MTYILVRILRYVRYCYALEIVDRGNETHFFIFLFLLLLSVMVILALPLSLYCCEGEQLVAPSAVCNPWKINYV